MLPVIALVGRPNVGKSTLFNRLTKTQDALVANMPGLTRDRQYGYCQLDQQRLILIDTGGMTQTTDDLEKMMMAQTQKAIEEADAVIFMMDARDGLTPEDQRIVKTLRGADKPLFVVVNKIDGLDAEMALLDFHTLGLGEPIGIAASHGRGVHALLQNVVDACCPDQGATDQESEPQEGIAVALVGKPNAGKSTLINRLLGEERMVVSEIPGTTRDSVSHQLERQGQTYRMIDTAGIRRRSRVDEKVEKFSVCKTLNAIDMADVVLMLIDVKSGISDQDLKLLGHVMEAGRALVIALNKWDALTPDEHDQVKSAIDRQLHFVDFANQHHISALKGRGVGQIFKSIQSAYRASTRDIPTTQVTSAIQQLVEQHPPPMAQGRRIKLRYAHMGGHQPPLFVIHGNQVELLPKQYQRYLINGLRNVFKLHGTAIRLRFKSGDNPFAGQKNTLNARQIKKRQRLKKFIQKKKK